MIRNLNKYLNYKYYGELSAFPLSAVSISEDFSIIKKKILKINDDFEKSIYFRRIGLFDISLYYAKISNQKKNNLITKLNLVISHYDNLNYTEAKELLSKIKSNHSSYYLYRHYLFNSLINPYKSSEKLLFKNPLLFFALRRQLKFKFINNGIFSKLLNENNALPFLILIKSNLLNTVNNQDKKKILILVNKYRHVISLDETALSLLINIFGVDSIIKSLTYKNNLIITCEIIEVLFSKLTEFNSFFQKKLIKNYKLNTKYLSKITANRIIDNILSEPYLLKDKNTSNFGSRYHTLDLSKSKNQDFIKLKHIFLIFLKDYFKKTMMKTFISNKFKIKYKKSFGIWFDASLSYGESKINSHLHTNIYKTLNLCTMVIYLKVPKLKRKEGNLIIFNRKNEKTIFIPKNYSVLIFPSWFKHETTPVKKNEIRLTLNADLFLKNTELTLK